LYCVFYNSLQCPIRLHGDIESIGSAALPPASSPTLESRPSFTLIPERILWNCSTLFSLELSTLVYIHSLELPEIVTEIKNAAFYNYRSLRNVAFPPNAVISDNAVIDNNIIFGQRYNDMTDLQKLYYGGFEPSARIERDLKHQFDELPVHRFVYYQSVLS
jgi:hypothetical protein